MGISNAYRTALFKFTFLGMRMYINKWDETHLKPLCCHPWTKGQIRS